MPWIHGGVQMIWTCYQISGSGSHHQLCVTSQIIKKKQKHLQIVANRRKFKLERPLMTLRKHASNYRHWMWYRHYVLQVDSAVNLQQSGFDASGFLSGICLCSAVNLQHCLHRQILDQNLGRSMKTRLVLKLRTPHERDRFGTARPTWSNQMKYVPVKRE